MATRRFPDFPQGTEHRRPWPARSRVTCVRSQVLPGPRLRLAPSDGIARGPGPGEAALLVAGGIVAPVVCRKTGGGRVAGSSGVFVAQTGSLTPAGAIVTVIASTWCLPAKGVAGDRGRARCVPGCAQRRERVSPGWGWRGSSSPRALAPGEEGGEKIALIKPAINHHLNLNNRPRRR